MIRRPPQQPHEPHPDGLPRVGDQVGPYQLTAEIGRGSLGVVFRALDQDRSRWVAVKLPRPGARDAELELRAEARLTGRFRHRNIIRSLGAGEIDGMPFLALELLDGEDLGHRIDRQGCLPLEEAVRIGADVARGLSALHRRGVIHRDLKPANVQITSDGRAKILDLGTPAAQRRRMADGSYEYFGTPEYSAPEQCMCEEKDVGPRTDLYALGILLYEMLAGRPPFCHPSTTRTLRDQVRGRPVEVGNLRPGLPEELRQLVRQLLEKRADDRPRSASEVAGQLERLTAVATAGEPLN